MNTESGEEFGEREWIDPQAPTTGETARGDGKVQEKPEWVTASPVDVVTAEDALAALAASWDAPRGPAIATGLRSIDAALYGGLRPGAVVLVGGPAGAGKSIVSGQVAYHAARGGACVLYASVEMDAAELAARWLSARHFAPAIGGEQLGTLEPIPYGALLAGRHNRERDTELARAAEHIGAETAGRLRTMKVSPGMTANDLATAAQRARDATKADRVLLIIDPLQRLYVAQQGAIDARVAASLNQSETERVGAVAQQVKALAETAGLAVWCNSDTTKAAVRGAESSETSLRGSYMLNHAATLVMSIATADDHDGERVVSAVAGQSPSANDRDRFADTIRRALPSWWERDHRVRESLGGAVAVLECTKNRNGPKPETIGVLLRTVATFYTSNTEGEVLPRKKGRR